MTHTLDLVLAWLPWWLPPLLALALGLMALAPLGEQVLQRGVVFIDLAVAQAAAAAALWWIWWQDHPPAWSVQLAALAGALLAVVWVRQLARRHPDQREALIGLVYVLGAALAVLGASQDPHGREHLASLLAADVLWADWPQVAAMATLAGLGQLWRVWRRPRPQAWPAPTAAGQAPAASAAPSAKRHTATDTAVVNDVGFYLGFAIVASVAVGVLGLWLVFAGLIVPAWLRWQGWSLVRSAAALLAASAAGLGLSSALDWPSGACVILVLALLGLLTPARRA